MATILLDSCILIDLSNPQNQWYEWTVTQLERLDLNNQLVINPIIYAECSVMYQTIEEIEAYINNLGLPIRELPREALFLAGKAFLNYKRNQGSKVNVLPDFFIGAHAAVDNLQLMTRDKGRYSSYFPSVELIMPKPS